MNNDAKLSKIKMILFTIFGFLGLVGTNLLVFFLSTLQELYIAMIIFDILAVGIMLGIPVKEFIQTFVKIQNGTSTVVNTNGYKELIAKLDKLTENHKE